MYPDRARVPREMWFRMMTDASEHIDVLVISGTFYAQTQPHVARMLAAAAGRGVGVRLCFGDPASEAVAIRDREEGIGDTLAAKIRSSLTYYRPLADVDRCEMRLHSTTLYSSLFRYDDEIMVNPHAYGEPAQRTRRCTCAASTAASSPSITSLLRAGLGDCETVVRRGDLMGRTEYLNDPAAPEPNTLVPACGVLVVDEQGGPAPAPPRHRPVGDARWASRNRRDRQPSAPSAKTEEETGIRAEITGILGVYSDPGHIVAYTDGEIRQEWEMILLGRPVSGTPTVNDEASDVRWFTAADLDGLDIHPTQWRQLGDWLNRAWPHVD